MGYRFQTNGGQKAHLREKIRKAASMMGLGRYRELRRGDMIRIGAGGCGCLTGLTGWYGQ